MGPKSYEEAREMRNVSSWSSPEARDTPESHRAVEYPAGHNAKVFVVFIGDWVGCVSRKKRGWRLKKRRVIAILVRVVPRGQRAGILLSDCQAQPWIGLLDLGRTKKTF